MPGSFTTAIIYNVGLEDGLQIIRLYYDLLSLVSVTLNNTDAKRSLCVVYALCIASISNSSWQTSQLAHNNKLYYFVF